MFSAGIKLESVYTTPLLFLVVLVAADPRSASTKLDPRRLVENPDESCLASVFVVAPVFTALGLEA